MTRTRAMRHIACAAALMVLVLGVGEPGVGFASPSDPSAQCAFTLDPPHVAKLNGTDVVVARVVPSTCPASTTPAESVVCLSASSDDSSGRCARNPGVAVAQVSYPYRAGTVYTARGTGCTATYQPPAKMCRPVGPVVAAL
jgi:hypothetical protein